MVTESFNLSTLRAIDIFEPLTDLELEVLRPALRVMEATDGDVVVLEGADGNRLYILLHGECKVVNRHTTPDAHVIGNLTPTDVFGEMALLTGEPRSATVIATQDCKFLTLDRDGLDEVLLEHPAVCVAMLRHAYKRIYALQWQLSGVVK